MTDEEIKKKAQQHAKSWSDMEKRKMQIGDRVYVLYLKDDCGYRFYTWACETIVDIKDESQGRGFARFFYLDTCPQFPVSFERIFKTSGLAEAAIEFFEHVQRSESYKGSYNG